MPCWKLVSFLSFNLFFSRSRPQLLCHGWVLVFLNHWIIHFGGVSYHTWLFVVYLCCVDWLSPKSPLAVTLPRNRVTPTCCLRHRNCNRCVAKTLFRSRSLPSNKFLAARDLGCYPMDSISTQSKPYWPSGPHAAKRNNKKFDSWARNQSKMNSRQTKS